jgi:uroporphyrinogen-III synthase
MTKSPRGKPLSGVRILVGRARRQASALSAGLKALGAEVIEIPFIEIRPPRSYKRLDTAFKNIEKYDWLILTSVNGVGTIASRMEILRLSPNALKRLSIAAIGPATRDAITRLGLKVAVVPDRYVAESLVESLRDKVNGKRVLLARAKIARDVIPRELRKIGARVDVVEAYETVVPQSSKRELRSIINDPARRPHLITFTSSSTVRNFEKLLRGQECPRHTAMSDIKFASIGPVTSATLRELGVPVDIEAKEYTIPGLINAVELALFKAIAGTTGSVDS